MIFGTLRHHDTESLQQAFGPVSAGVQEALTGLQATIWLHCPVDSTPLTATGCS